MTKPFPEIGRTDAEPVSDDGRPHSFSRLPGKVKVWLFFQESDLEVKIMHFVFMNSI